MIKTYKRYLAPVISVLVLVLLLTFSFTAVKSNTAKAEIYKTEIGDIFKLTTNYPDVAYDCTYVLLVSGMLPTFEITPNYLPGYTFIRAELIDPDRNIKITDTAGGKVSIQFPPHTVENIDPQDLPLLVRVILTKVISLPPTPTREGYTFTRWYLDEDCTIPYNGEEITQDMTFYAGWTINRYTVTFNSNLGSSAPTQTVEYNTNLTLTTPTREGYDFLGWYNGNTLFTNETLVKSNLTLTAKWKIKTYTVTFMVDNKVYKTIEVEHGTSLAIAMQKANLTYFAAFNSSGERIGTVDSITKNTSVIVGELTTEEKIYTFLANNSWVLWLGGVCSAMFFVTIITLIVKKVRG